MPDLKTATIDNTSITSDFFRNKVSLVNFMYFGCKPCMVEIQTLNNISSSFSADQFQLISITAHTKEEVVAFLSDSISAYSSVRKHYGINTVNYRIIAECNPRKTNEVKDEITLGCNTLSKKFHVRGYPTTFLIDKNGYVRKVFEGFSLTGRDSVIENNMKREISKLIEDR